MTPAPHPASSVIVRHEGRLLLIKRSNPPSQDLFAFPGGRGEDGEAPDETALRELLEETGLTGKNPRLFATYDLYPDNDGPDEHHFSLSVFLVDIEGDVTVAVASSDAKELGWYTPQDILTLPAPPSVLDCVERLVKASENAYT
ncbi:NUDIX domain-containing protein [Rhizobium sp.]|jgi:8-oxo-dGTP diphosphatase|uniref:NUDIX hydrolase n=1 Tax=Rhizobium sp. TaxID=391 RepID=UPI000E9C62D7|nr:ADP-ribose pyrophosphatase [Rhizobium sp.]